MPKFNKNQKKEILQHYAELLEEINKLAKEKGIATVEISGLVIKPTSDTPMLANCPCGTEDYVTSSGVIKKRCKKCPPASAS